MKKVEKIVDAITGEETFVERDETAAEKELRLEAIAKAETTGIRPKKLQLIFERNKPPVVLDPNNTLSGEYVLSLTHEDGYVVAVAFRKN